LHIWSTQYKYVCYLQRTETCWNKDKTKRNNDNKQQLCKNWIYKLIDGICT